jgi:hypothetical protein
MFYTSARFPELCQRRLFNNSKRRHIPNRERRNKAIFERYTDKRQHTKYAKQHRVNLEGEAACALVGKADPPSLAPYVLIKNVHITKSR